MIHIYTINPQSWSNFAYVHSGTTGRFPGLRSQLDPSSSWDPGGIDVQKTSTSKKPLWKSPIGYNNSGYNTNNSDYIWLYDGINYL